MSPAHDIALYLESIGLGTFGDDIHVSREPVTPEFATTLYDTGGNAPTLINEQLRNPTIQVRVRSNNYPQAYARQEAINAALAVDRTSFETDDYRYVGVWMTSDVISIGRDDNDRHLLTANYEIKRHPKGD